MIWFARLLLVLCWVAPGVVGQRNESKKYYDFEAKCDNGQKISTVQGEYDRSEKYRQLQFKCQNLWNKDKLKNVQCNYKMPLKCNNTKEGCAANEWLAGLRVLDVGVSVPILTPYCCKATNYQTGDCKPLRIANFQGNHFTEKVSPNEAFGSVRCFLFTDRNSVVYDSQMRFEHCAYKIDGTVAPGDAQVGSESDYKGFNSGAVPGATPPVSAQTSAPSGNCNCTCKCPPGTVNCAGNARQNTRRRDASEVLRMSRQSRKEPSCRCTCFCRQKC